MKRLLLSIFPLLMVMCAMFFGCTSLSASDNIYPEACYFSTSTPVVLMKDTPNYKSNVNLIVEGEEVTMTPNVEWDTSVIDYDLVTGEITAVGVGSTYIKVSYYTNAYHTEERSLYVCVCEPDFAQNIELESIYKLKNNALYPYTITPIINVEEGNYNLTTDFFSRDTNIFTIDQNGTINPTGLGEATLTVRAVSGYNSETQVYTYLTETTTIKVEPYFTSLTVDLCVDLCDSEKQELSAENNVYNLFYGTPVDSENSTFYYAKITSNFSLENAQIIALTEGTQNSDMESPLWSMDLQDYAEADIEYNADFTVAFIPIRSMNKGSGSLSFALTDSSALNTEIILNTNELEIASFTYITAENFSVKTYSSILENKEEYASVADSFIDIETDSETGYNLLYALGGNATAKDEGHKDGNYYFALIIFDNTDDYCYNNFTISNNSDNISLTKIIDNLYHIQANTVGIAYVTICANDGGQWRGEFSFQVLEVEAEQYAFYEEDEIYLVLGEEEQVNLAVRNIQPSYTTYTYEITSSFTDTQPIDFMADESTIYAIAKGNCWVTVSFAGESVAYLISVISSGSSIIVAFLEYTIEQNKGINITYTVQDAYGNLADNQQVKVYFIVGEQEVDTCEYVCIEDFICGDIRLHWLKSGTVQIRLALIENGVEIDTTDAITITCK